MRTLVIGATGILGSNIIKTFSEDNKSDIYGTIRNDSQLNNFRINLRENLFQINDANDDETIKHLLYRIEPDVVINCLSLSTAKLKKENADSIFDIYSKLPHKLSKICKENHTRYINISSDGVFSGNKGNYKETDTPDPVDKYGISKMLGEVSGKHSINIRTSFFGHSISREYGLLDWFLSQKEKCFGYSEYRFSGIPAIILARIIKDHVIPNKELTGTYHIGGPSITKYDLFKLIASVYKKEIIIDKDENAVADRSLNSSKFLAETDYKFPNWTKMIEMMHSFD